MFYYGAVLSSFCLVGSEAPAFSGQPPPYYLEAYHYDAHIHTATTSSLRAASLLSADCCLVACVIFYLLSSYYIYLFILHTYIRRSTTTT